MTHPLPDTPGAVIGYRKNGAPIRLIAGGNGEGDGGTGSEGTQDNGTGGTGTPPAATDGGAQPSSGEPAGPGSGSAAAAQPGTDETPRVIAALREDFKGERAKRQQAERDFAAFKADAERKEAERAAAETERNKKLAIALGVASEDEPPDPAKLAEELQRTRAQHTEALAAKDAEVRQRDLRLAVLTQAPAAGANGALLMDSMSFLAKVSSLDPAADDFTERLTEAVTAAAEANPNYKLTPPAAPPRQPAPARSGGEFNGAPGGNRQWTVEDVERASPDEVVKAQEDGLLAGLGYNPRKKR